MNKRLKLLGYLLLYTCVVHADPWFTGPLLAEAAETIPLGHWNFELFNFFTTSNAIYGKDRRIVKTDPNSNTQIVPQISYGLTDDLDFELDPMFIQNKTDKKIHNDVGDTTAILGMQLIRQKENSWRPDLRVTLEEILPSGHYDHLLESNYGTDSTGMGSYQTTLGFNFQKLQHITKENYLNSHLSFSYLYASSVKISGISTYGGNALTHGQVKPGSLYTLDLAEELSLTQHWVAVLEGFMQYQQADRFFGEYGQISNRLTPDIKKHLKARLAALFPTRRNISALFLDSAKIGNGTMNLFSLAPAIEYNFSDNYGLIAGSWFSIYGKNVSKFASFAIGFNAYF